VEDYEFWCTCSQAVASHNNVHVLIEVIMELILRSKSNWASWGLSCQEYKWEGLLGRELLQDAAPAAPGTNCGFQFGDTSKTYARCQNLADSLNADYTIFYDFLPSKTDQLLGRLDVALDGPTKGNQYIAFGIPVTPDTMTGGSAMVIKSNSSADSGMQMCRTPFFPVSQASFLCLCF
jgi:hypothetical protein